MPVDNGAFGDQKTKKSKSVNIRFSGKIKRNDFRIKFRKRMIKSITH